MGTSPQLTLILPFLTALGAILCSPLPCCFHGNAFSSFSALWFLYRFDQWEAPTETGRWEKEINRGISPSFLPTSEDVSSSNYQSPRASVSTRLASWGPSSSALEHCHLSLPLFSPALGVINRFYYCSFLSYLTGHLSHLVLHPSVINSLY